MRDLVELWSKAYEACQAYNPKKHEGPALKVQFKSNKSAKSARRELYRLRRRAQNAAKIGISPDDPSWGVTIWDGITIVHPGADRNNNGGEFFLYFFPTEIFRADSGQDAEFTIVQELPQEIIKTSTRRYTRKLPGKAGSNSA